MERCLDRKIDGVLLGWRDDPGRKPLLVKGARQIGKTEAIRHFARARYDHFHEINFVLREEFKQIVEDGCSVQAILRRIIGTFVGVSNFTAEILAARIAC